MSQLPRRRAAKRGYDEDDERETTRRRPSRDRYEDDADEGYDDPPFEPDEDEDDRRSSRRGRGSSRDEGRRPRDRDSSRELRRDRSRDEPRGRRSRDEDDEDETVSRGRGWDAYGAQRAKKASNPHRLQVKDKEVIVKFLEPEPFAVYEQHWVGNRSYTCPEENKCPLCDAGWDTRTLALFNVVLVETAESMFFEAGPAAAKKIRSASEKKSTSPINRDGLYFSLTRKKQSNGFYDYEVEKVDEDDLEQYYKYEPLSKDELRDAKDNLFDDSVIPVTKRRDLVAVADSDEDDD